MVERGRYLAGKCPDIDPMLCANICASIRSKNTSTEKHFVLEMPSYTSSLIKSLLIAIIFDINDRRKKKTLLSSLLLFFPINHFFFLDFERILNEAEGIPGI